MEMKFGICNEIFQGWNLEETFRFAKKTGYDGVEIAPFTIAKYVTEISKEKRRSIREEAERVGIEISGIHWVLVQAEGMYVNISRSWWIFART
jgi:sugar phosphate isomerase/epimerase